MGKGFAPKGRFWLLAVAFLAAYAGIGYRLVELHVLRRPELLAEIKERRERFVTLEARRGDILDARGGLLATSQTFLEVGVDPALVQADDLAKLPDLARLLGEPLADVKKAFGIEGSGLFGLSRQKGVRWRLLKRRVKEEVYAEIQKLDMRCVYGNRDYSRVYPKDSMASHVVGYMRNDGKAVMGVERAFDYYLSGQMGWRESEARGAEEMAQFRRRQVPPADGMSVVLSIDPYAQHTAEEALAAIERERRPDWAAVIVSDPYTGFIAAMACLPGFDQNRYWEYAIENQLNRAVASVIEPGSTFKIVAVGGALEQGLARPDTLIDCSLEFAPTRSGRLAPLPDDGRERGELTLAEVMALSSNRGVAQLGLQLGKERFYKYARRFGFGERTGFSIGPEEPGLLAPPRRWDGLTITRMPIGYAVGVTPLQLHMAMSAVANEGILMRPQVVERLLDAEGDTAVSFGPVSRRRALSGEAAQVLTQLLERVASADGTAGAARIPGYRVAGKTGTARKLVDGRYDSSRHVASFSGFLPADAPQLAITIVVDSPEAGAGSAYGGTVAAPVFRDVAAKLIPYYGIAPASEGESSIVSNLPPARRADDR